MLDIPEYSKYRGEKNIALMDNSTVAFLEKLERFGFPGRRVLEVYDAILIPDWVSVEICDSAYRKRYVETLLEDGLPIFRIAEDNYDRLVNGEEGNLYRIVYAASSTLGAMKSYLRRHVQVEDTLNEDRYSHWITHLYDNWPLATNNTGNGRETKKNAGEISAQSHFLWDFSFLT